MLTKGDLGQLEKLTRSIVREEIEAEGDNIRTDLGGEIKLTGIRIASELREVNSRLKNLEISTTKLSKDLKLTSNFLDKENLRAVKRIRKIEEHLNIPEPGMI